MLTQNGKIMIAGPCALESRQQLKESVTALKDLEIGAVRASLWKPRTQPGWEGHGLACLPILLEETLSKGIIPATEIISADHAQLIVDFIKYYGKQGRILVWLGARNQNHLEQTKIAKILADGPEGITFMFKNQMWEDERHWMGIYEHITSAGFPKQRLMICHRGFSPGKLPNPHGYRNLPDFDMAMRIKEKTNLPMILDPSHIGGTVENVYRIVEEANQYDFDGYIIEVHHNPGEAKTDVKQQLSVQQFAKLLKLIDRPKVSA